MYMYIQVHDQTRVFLLSFVCTRIKDKMNVCLTEKNMYPFFRETTTIMKVLIPYQVLFDGLTLAVYIT